jgi:Helix-turn-helix domain
MACCVLNLLEPGQYMPMITPGTPGEPSDVLERILEVLSPKERRLLLTGMLLPPHDNQVPKGRAPRRPVAITLAHATEVYGISRTALWRLRRDGKIKAVKCGLRGVRIVVASLESYLGLDDPH